DITLRMADFGFHLWSSHHPFIVPEPFTIEPTESYSKDEIDEYLLHSPAKWRDRTVVAVVSGGNVSPERFRAIAGPA
ncbi:MAG: hypothetical protein IH583_00735, partial [Candidatus Aminicenantes bacterium]|nr:hypothetical protein [Candidatus Aminicenantes bacterium]